MSDSALTLIEGAAAAVEQQTGHGLPAAKSMWMNYVEQRPGSSKTFSSDVYMKVLSRDVVGLRSLLRGRTLTGGLLHRGQQVLVTAIEVGDVAAVRVLLEAGVPMDLLCREGRGRIELPIVTAIRLNKREAFEELLRFGCSLQSPSIGIECVKERRPEMLQRLLREGMELDFLEQIMASSHHALPPSFLKFVSNSLDLVVRCCHYLPHCHLECHDDLTSSMCALNAAGASLLVAVGANIVPSRCLSRIPDSTSREEQRVLHLLNSASKGPQTLMGLTRHSVRRAVREAGRYRQLEELYQRSSTAATSWVGIPRDLVGYLLLEGETRLYHETMNRWPNRFRLIWF